MKWTARRIVLLVAILLAAVAVATPHAYAGPVHDPIPRLLAWLI